MRIVRQYYRIQKSKGHSAGKATLLLPLKTLNQISLKLRRRSRPTQGKAITGCSRFDLPLLASYSRSGTNWIRYFIETCSGRPTPGQRRRLSGDDYIIDRAHCAYPVIHRYSKVILVIRDYRECLLRHNKDHWKPGMDIAQFLEDQQLDQPCEWYIKNIQAFDQFRRDKLLLYYEDIINAPETEFRRLGSFLGLPEDTVVDFIHHIEDHFQASVSRYTAGGHSSETSKTRSTTAHADAMLGEEEKREFDDYFISRYNILANRYLKRYFIEAVNSAPGY